MNVNEYFYNLAERAAALAGELIDPKWIYCQWFHETGGFASELSDTYYNLGGLTQVTPNDTPQPDGTCYYMQFTSYEDYAEYFGKYLRYYEENGIYNAGCLEDYVRALKDGGYFGDTLENYINGCMAVYEASFVEDGEDD